MRQIGTSHGGTGGFGAEEDALGGFGGRAGGQAGDQAGLGLRRDGREDGRGRERGFGERGADARARAFRDRMDDARTRLGRGAGREADERADPTPRGDARPEVPLFGRSPAAGGHDRDAPGDAGAGRAAPDDGSTTAAEHRQAPDDARIAAGTVLRGAEARGDGTPRRLLAAAEPPADALAALFAAPPSAMPRAAAGGEAQAPGPGAPAGVERRIADIADRVERALAADLAAGAGAPIALRIPLDGGGDGLSSLTVTATAEGLDVTLSRADGAAAPSPELLRAAQGLADRLQRRLARGSVRVFEGVEAAAGPRSAEDGWAGLSAILGRGTA